MSASKARTLGISPYVHKGLRGWRVMWRVPMSSPNRQKTKSDDVRTERFPICNGVTEDVAYAGAVECARRVYPSHLVSERMPEVDWESLARAAGEKIRDRYIEYPIERSLDKALAMFKAGMGDQTVGTSLGVHRTTAMRWRRRLIKEGRLQET